MRIHASADKDTWRGEVTRTPMVTRRPWSGMQAVTQFLALAVCVLPYGTAFGVGHVIGTIDGIAQDGEQAFVSGWACQQGRKESIKIHIFAAGEMGAADSFLTANEANLPSEPAVNARCQDREDANHRFFAALPLGSGRETLVIRGIRIVDGVPNDALRGSGKPLRRFEQLQMPVPFTNIPRISGSYRGSDSHPRVFETAADLEDLASRINRPGSYSARRFAQLSAHVARDVASSIRWDATYSGCVLEPYLYAFSYEPQGGHDVAMRAALGLEASAKAPAGGAVVAARLALYAALVKAGAKRPDSAPEVRAAIATAKEILLAWADRGFPRDASGGFASYRA